MRLIETVLLFCWFSASCKGQVATHASGNIRKIVLLRQPADSYISDSDLSALFAKHCSSYTISSDAEKYDYVLETSARKKEIRSLAVYDHSGLLIRETGSGATAAVKEICHALDTAILIEVVDMNNFTQTSDLRNLPPRSGLPGVVDAIHGQRNTLTDNASLNVIANGERALLDCYEHHKGCTTISPGKYYAEIVGASIWIEYTMPITHEPQRNHYVIAGGW